MAQVTDEVIEHLKRWEGLRLEAYPDPGSKDGSPWTIGYGHTSDPFMRVTKGMVITEEQAEAALRHDAEEAAAAVRRRVRVPLTANQLGALVSFVFNLGESQFAKSTLLKRLNEGKYDAVTAELAKWKYNDNKVMQGLVNRRAAEAGLWAKGGFVTSQNVEAKQEPVAGKAVRPEVITAVGGVLASGAGLANGDGWVQLAIAGGIGVAVLVAAVVVLRRVFRD